MVSALPLTNLVSTDDENISHLTELIILDHIKNFLEFFSWEQRYTHCPITRDQTSVEFFF
jgi:hypothetical protein